MNRNSITVLLGSALILSSLPAYGDNWSANAAVANNYIWRGLTQSENVAAVSGGIDYAHDSGWYAGTWVSNVSYAPGDVFSYEHDVYLGYAGKTGEIDYDLGYLYYNYDDEAQFDFAEVYGSVSYSGFTFSVNLLAHTEADENAVQDFGFAQTVYLNLAYSTEIGDGIELSFSAGYHDGDFNEAFNGVPDSYLDYNVTLAKNGFGFMLTSTDLPDAGPEGLDNDGLKFVISYSVDFEL